eukprot:14652357-Heterocapsa_arctica.AAC.1
MSPLCLTLIHLTSGSWTFCSKILVYILFPISSNMNVSDLEDPGAGRGLYNQRVEVLDLALR